MVGIQTVERRGCNLGVRSCLQRISVEGLCPLFAGLASLGGIPPLLRDPTGVELKNLTDVHTTGDTHRVQDDVNRGAIREERHVFNREDLRDDTLVTVASSHLVTNGDLATLCDEDAYRLLDTRAQVAIVLVQFANINDDALFTVGNTQGGVTHLARLLTEDGAQQALFAGQFGFTLRGDLANQDVARANLSTNADDAAFVEVGHGFLRDVGNIPGYLFNTKFGFAGIDLVLLNVD